jgi:hypothetical protein
MIRRIIPPLLYVETDHALTKPTGRVADSDSMDQGGTRIQGASWRGSGIAPGFRHDEVLGKSTEKAAELKAELDRIGK